MEVYLYDVEGYFIGVGYADPDPYNEGQYLMPFNSTTDKNPAEKKGYRARRVDDVWKLEKVPIIVPEPVSSEADGNEAVDHNLIIRERCDFFIKQIDKAIGTAIAAGAAIPQEWRNYRDAYVAIAEAGGDDVEAIVWPADPDPIKLPVAEVPLIDFLADVRYQREIAGIFISGKQEKGSLEVATDRSSRLALAEKVDDTKDGETVLFKFKNEWINATHEELALILRRARDYVQECYNLEKEISDKIALGQITTFEEIAQSNWPSRYIE